MIENRNEILNLIAAGYGATNNGNLSMGEYLNSILVAMGGEPVKTTRNEYLELILKRAGG